MQLQLEEYKNEEISDYENIPNNDRMLFDLKLTGLNYELNGKSYVLDLGINRSENDLKDNSEFYYSGRVVDQGDLSTSYGYDQIDASDLKLEMGKIYPEEISSKEDLDKLDAINLLKEGYAYLKVDSLMLEKNYSHYPLNLVAEDFEINDELKPGAEANFFLKKDGVVEYAIINGFLCNLIDPKNDIKNTLIYK